MDALLAIIVPPFKTDVLKKILRLMSKQQKTFDVQISSSIINLTFKHYIFT